MNIRISHILCFLLLATFALSAESAVLKVRFGIPTLKEGSLVFTAKDGIVEGGIIDRHNKSGRKVYLLSGKVIDDGRNNLGDSKYSIRLRVSDGTTLRGKLRTETRWINEFQAERVYVFEGKVSSPRLLNQRKRRFHLEQVYGMIII